MHEVFSLGLEILENLCFSCKKSDITNYKVHKVHTVFCPCGKLRKWSWIWSCPRSIVDIIEELQLDWDIRFD